MRPKLEEIDCPRCPDHGKTNKRWLRGSYQAVSGGAGVQVADIFEIDCPTCGKYEIREELSHK